MDEQPIYKAEHCHTGGHLCPHAHRTYMSAYRCLPRLATQAGAGAFSMAMVIPMNEAAQREMEEHEDNT